MKMLIKNKKVLKIFSFIIILSLCLPLLYLNFSNSSKPNKSEDDLNIKDQINNEKALELMAIHENPNKYKGESLEITGQFFLDETLNDKFLVGVIDKLDNGEEFLFPILARMEDNTIPKGFKAYDKVKISGVIELFDELHDGHIHKSPVILINSIKKIEG